MSKVYYCPKCGKIETNESTKCNICDVDLCESLHEKYYYENKSGMLYRSYAKWKEILTIEEIEKDSTKTKEINDIIEKRQHEYLMSKMGVQNNKPKCPTCNSTNIVKISNVKRAAHGYLFGLLSNTARSQFECKNCGYKW